MKASGYNPKAEFFLALGTFNKVVAEQELLAVKDTAKDRLTALNRYAWRMASCTAALNFGAFTPG